jgi:hypothetical protein
LNLKSGYTIFTENQAEEEDQKPAARRESDQLTGIVRRSFEVR